MLKKIRHIGIVVENLGISIARFTGFGLSCSEVIENEEIGLKCALFPIGDSMIEFLHYTSPKKNHDHVVRSQKGAINHICFEVANLQASIQAFEKNGAKLVKGFPKDGVHGRIAFFYPETTEGILIELCQVIE